jgi:hypothetical protein
MADNTDQQIASVDDVISYLYDSDHTDYYAEYLSKRVAAL